MNELGRFYLAGVAGAAAMSVAGSVARRAGVRVDLEMLTGTSLFGAVVCSIPRGANRTALGGNTNLDTGGSFVRHAGPEV